MGSQPIGAPLRWGVLGAGAIARTVGTEILDSAAHEVVAVAARDHARAAALADELRAPRAYGSYADLVADDAIDVVYVATTHAQHHGHALLAIDAGKPVLVEKAFTLNARQAREVAAAARSRGLFCMEGMWMRFNPLLRRAVELVGSGAIGEVISVRADLSSEFPYDPRHRLYDLAAGGGVLLDLGVYVANFAWMFLGRPEATRTTGALAPTGADVTAALQWTYSGGRFAQLACTARGRNPLTGVVAGTAGWISMGMRVHRPSELVLNSRGQTYTISAERPAGYLDELGEVAGCLRTGRTESEIMPLSDTIEVLEVLDAARAELGVRYPAD
ncbi:MAG: Gfo/Idh/MocA family oxidoreductase [Actinobacteria bacterium]|nr:Gfo/Idh/MocA family oxidoreductase [Actinomycetota bacterium]